MESNEDNNTQATDPKEIINKITDNVKTTCEANFYTHLCNRIRTEGGLTWVVNRCIKMMASDSIKLSGALASLEAELEGMG